MLEESMISPPQISLPAIPVLREIALHLCPGLISYFTEGSNDHYFSSFKFRGGEESYKVEI